MVIRYTKTFLLSGLLCSHVLLYAQSHKHKVSELADAHIKGQVKTIQSKQYAATMVSGKLVKEEPQPADMKGYGVTTYNKAGYMTMFIGYNNNGSVQKKVIHKLDSNNHVLDELYYGSVGKLVDRKTYHLDRYENVVAIYFYNVKGLPYQSDSSIYDINGNCINYISYSEDHKQNNRIRYVYDLHDNEIEDDEYNNTSQEYEVHIKEIYDANNNEIEEDQPSLRDKTVFVYDARGNRLMETVTTGDKFLNRDIYKYDSLNNELEHIYYSRDSVHFDSKDVYQYDKYSNQIFYERTSSDGKTLDDKTTYEYDKQGNIIKQTESKMGEMEYFVTENTYTYY